MSQSPSPSAASPATSDRLTVIAISALAYIAAIGLHEHLGHALSCVVLGSHPTELGAFFINCDDSGLSDLRVRLVALAGPMVNLVLGLLCFLILRLWPPRQTNAWFFVWLLGTLSVMFAAGYLLFSGATGIGDFGDARDAVFYQVSPEWLWRTILTILGAGAYFLVVRFTVREIDPHISGVGRPRITYARLLVLASYLTGAALTLGISLLDVHVGLVVAFAEGAGTLGGTSGLLWMMQFLDRQRQVAPPGLVIQRSWGWIAAGVLVTLIYAAVLGPTLHF